MLFIRLFEDAVLVGRFLYYFKKAPEHLPGHVGFVRSNEGIPLLERSKYAWTRAKTLWCTSEPSRAGGAPVRRATTVPARGGPGGGTSSGPGGTEAGGEQDPHA